jgi:hypothetical protein
MTFIKVLIFSAVFLLNCHREKLLVHEAAMKPPIFSHTFIVKTRVTDLFSEPSLESSKLVRLSSNEEVKISAEIRKVTDSVKNRPILLLMVRYRIKLVGLIQNISASPIVPPGKRDYLSLRSVILVRDV